MGHGLVKYVDRMAAAAIETVWHRAEEGERKGHMGCQYPQD